MNTFPGQSRQHDSDYLQRTLSAHQAAALMGAIAITLAMMSFLHLTGILDGSTKTLNGSAAGIAEAVLCLVLGYGTAALLRNGPRAWPIALASTGFAILGFLVGVSFTLRGGSVVDIAYHLGSLPILFVTMIVLLRIRAADPWRLTAVNNHLDDDDSNSTHKRNKRVNQGPR